MERGRPARRRRRRTPDSCTANRPTRSSCGSSDAPQPALDRRIPTPGTRCLRDRPIPTRARHGGDERGQQHPPSENGNPLVDMQTMAPTSRLDDPGIGLRDNGRRVLTYADLKSVSTIRTVVSPDEPSSSISPGTWSASRGRSTGSSSRTPSRCASITANVFASCW